MRAPTVLVFALAACNGEGGDGTDPTAPTGCDALVTAPLTTVPSEEWDPGIPAALDTYASVAGRWEAESSCGEATGVKITIAPEEQLQIVQQPYPEGSSCGCVSDPKYEGDSAYDPILLHENFQLYIETFDDPAVEGRTIPGQGALFGGDGPLRFRGCGSQNIDPVFGSEFDLMTTVMRIETSGAITGSILLVDEDGVSSKTCDLTNWVFVE